MDGEGDCEPDDNEPSVNNAYESDDEIAVADVTDNIKAPSSATKMATILLVVRQT